LFEVGVERGWESFEAFLVEILGAELVFEGEELFAVGGGGGEGRVVEREEEGVDVRDPSKAWWLDAGAHGYAVGEHSGDVGFVQYVGRVVASLLLADIFSCGFELRLAGGVERRLEVEVEDGLPRVVKCEQVGTRAGGVGVGLHGVDRECVEVAVGGVGGRREQRVGVVVDGRDGGDLRGNGGGDRGIAREIVGLCRAKECQQGERCGCEEEMT
jgi:hypothetical protein